MPIIKSDVHLHTTFCDGRDSMQDMAQYAADNGFDTLGFSFHSYTEFDKSYCIRDYYGYMVEYTRVKQLFKDKLTLLNGVELDLYGEKPSLCDYVIGSVHYIKVNGRYAAIDASEDIFCDIIARAYNGDAYALVEDYYRGYAELPQAVDPDIYGHFDLVTRYNNGGKYFDESCPRYLKSARSAIEALPKGAVVEINTGRAFRSNGDIYPSPKLIPVLKEAGARFMLSSDAHCCKAIGYKFDELLPRLKALGVTSLAAYESGKLIEKDI